MNILHIVITSKLSGAEKIALLISKNLNKDFNSSIICGGDELRNYYIENGIASESIDFEMSILKITKELHKYIINNNIDIIHAHDNKASLYAYITKCIYNENIKIISHVHNCYTWLKYNSMYKCIDWFVRNRYDLNLMCGKVVKDHYLEHSRYICKNKIKTISNFIDIYEIKSKMLDKHSIDCDKFIFGFIGRLCDQKGLIPFLNSLNKYKHKFNDSKFILVGSGDKEEEINDLIEKYNMKDLFELKGHRANPYIFFNYFDAFFLPSLYEGLPMVILESIVSKTPIVSMDVGSISEVINEKTGVLVESGNYDDFIEKLIWIKNNPKKREELAINAYQNIVTNYDVSKEVLKIEKVYLDLINK